MASFAFLKPLQISNRFFSEFNFEHSVHRQFGVCHRGRTAGCPSRPRTDPGVPFSSTGLFRSTRFRIRHQKTDVTYSLLPSLLWLAVRLALLLRHFLAGQCFLCTLRTSVSPFPL